jgi:hypothetical protein
MASKIVTLNPIIVPRLLLVPHYVGSSGEGSTAALYAPPPPESYTPSAPTARAPSTPTGRSRVAMFSAIGESLLGEDFAEQTLWWV